MSGLDGTRRQDGSPGVPFGPCCVLCHLTGHQRSVETVSFSPDSKQLASGGWDKQVVLWEVQVCGGIARQEAWDPDGTHTLTLHTGRRKVAPSSLLPMSIPGTQDPLASSCSYFPTHISSHAHEVPPAGNAL